VGLESKAGQPRFYLQDAIALDFDGSTGADANLVFLGIVGDRDLQGCSQFVQEQDPIARDLFDPCSDPGTILSKFRIHRKKTHRIVGFVLGPSDPKGVLREFGVVREGRIPSVLEYLGFRNNGRKGRFRNDSIVVVVDVNVDAFDTLPFLPEGDAALGGILFEESLDLCRGVFGSSGDIVVVCVCVCVCVCSIRIP